MAWRPKIVTDEDGKRRLISEQTVYEVSGFGFLKHIRSQVLIDNSRSVMRMAEVFQALCLIQSRRFEISLVRCQVIWMKPKLHIIKGRRGLEPRLSPGTENRKRKRTSTPSLSDAREELFEAAEKSAERRASEDDREWASDVAYEHTGERRRSQRLKR